MDDTCQYPPIGANQSGVKVLVAGFAKMGTRTLSRTLFQLGMERSYHGEELIMNVWFQHATNWLRRPENGGHSMPEVYIPWRRGDQGLQVLNGVPSEEFADSIARCRVDAVALDGVEKLFWPIYDVSPGIKVVVLNWRTYQEATTSMWSFMSLFIPYLVLVGHFNSAASALPWGLITYVTEPLFGRSLRERMRSGKMMVNQVQDPYEVLWYKFVCTVRVCSHWFSGLSLWEGMTEEEHTEFFDTIRRKVPPENRLDFDPRKHTYEDLCRFLGMGECRRSGRLPRAINLGNYEIDFFPGTALTSPIVIFMHWVNFKSFRWLSRLVWKIAQTALAASFALAAGGCTAPNEALQAGRRA
eukprot:CAMPEP_0204597642 /NCGR_PEP_ID=MMETSP0661-20131031/53910_1 /ASSEMBLY_ACC=CAM_ASM_000606 /TAXON_ID=109239 /ORGANISM="Alexandrium margalefi, Strain AMGDE01CS-322" /LENGTH=355 /DNA_ID=CAMNT_0051608339 /DNA_START=195 /DNA_END=1259 /DNA_ORIENTATION=+